MARKRYRKNPSGTTWLLLGGGGLLAWHLMKPKPVVMRRLPDGQVIPTAPDSGTGAMDLIKNRLREMFINPPPPAPKINRELLDRQSMDLQGYSSALGGDYGTLGGGRYGSLS